MTAGNRIGNEARNAQPTLFNVGASYSLEQLPEVLWSGPPWTPKHMRSRAV